MIIDTKLVAYFYNKQLNIPYTVELDFDLDLVYIHPSKDTFGMWTYNTKDFLDLSGDMLYLDYGQEWYVMGIQDVITEVNDLITG